MAQTELGISSRAGVVEFVSAQTLVNDAGPVAAGQKVITLDDTTGMLAGNTLEYMLIGGVIEQNVIDTTDSGTQVTMITNVGTGGIADNETVSKVVIMSGTAAAVTQSGGGRKVGEAFTAAGDTPILTGGKREAITVTVRGVYTSAANTPNWFEELHAVYASGAGCGVRWSPTAYSVAGQKRFWTTDTLGSYIQMCDIVDWNFPSLDFSSPDPIMCEFSVQCAAIGTTDHS